MKLGGQRQTHHVDELRDLGRTTLQEADSSFCAGVLKRLSAIEQSLAQKHDGSTTKGDLVHLLRRIECHMKDQTKGVVELRQHLIGLQRDMAEARATNIKNGGRDADGLRGAEEDAKKMDDPFARELRVVFLARELKHGDRFFWRRIKSGKIKAPKAGFIDTESIIDEADEFTHEFRAWRDRKKEGAGVTVIRRAGAPCAAGHARADALAKPSRRNS
ncbi:MAG: hypothetical protein WA268_15470 [Xanthobacteraceae bacterium]